MGLIFNQDDIKRFMSYVDILPNGCHFWTGARSRGKGNKKWYGSFWLPMHGTIRAHRFASEALGGHPPCPAGYHRDHICHFSLCVNPVHIELVTHAENQLRKMQRRKLLMAHYEAKSWCQFFQPIKAGLKKHDLRSTKDRPFKVGDTFLLREFDMVKGEYTGDVQLTRITFITSNDTPCAYSSAALERGYAILSLRLLSPGDCPQN